MSQTNGTSKLIAWILGALGSLASYVAVLHKSQRDDARKETEYYRLQGEIKDKMIVTERKSKDSLQGVIINRTDASYNELKDLLDIKNKKSTIIITPRK